MAVKTYYGSGQYDPATKPRVPLPGEETQGHVKQLVSTKPLLNGDSATSTINFGSVPSNARIHPLSLLSNDGLTSLVDFDLGIGKTVGGTFTMKDADCLVDGADIHTAGTKNAVSAVAIENYRKPLWEIAGYSDDPGGDLDIVGTINTAGPTADGDVTLNFLYATP